MYGFIHRALQDLIVRRYGKEEWKRIIDKAGIQEESRAFLLHQSYDDALTVKLVSTACEILGSSMENMLEKFGEHFFQYCVDNGYDRILRILGSTLYDFLFNLDALHDHLGSSYQGMNAPSFRCTSSLDGNIILHYYSLRHGLYPIVIGIVKTAAKQIHNTDVKIQVISISTTSKGKCHVQMLISQVDGNHPNANFIESAAQSPVRGERSSSFNSGATVATNSKIRIKVGTFCQAFPFHIMFNRQLKITQVGHSIRRVLKLPANLAEADIHFNSLFQLDRPQMRFNFKNVISHINIVFIISTINQSPEDPACQYQRQFSNHSLEYNTSNPSNNTNLRRNNSYNNTSISDTIKLKGQMIYVHDSDSMLFLCSPRFNSLEELAQQGFFISDFPIHDTTRDVILMSHIQRNRRDLVQLREQATNELQILEARLREDKRRTDDLLHSILPIRIVNQLRLAPRDPIHERYAMVTVLFSDIVGFTALCSSSDIEPLQVVRMLDELYLKFDELCTINDVYKVETIGDAYMVVSGVPEPCLDHADRVINMAFDMMEITKDVLSPVDKSPIKIRIGIHSGPAIAGVVGQKMPRFCLFGNTVTNASKVESGSLEGKINISEISKISIEDITPYVFEENYNHSLHMPCYFIDQDPNMLSRGSAIREMTRNLSVDLAVKQGIFRSPRPSPTHTPVESPVITPPMSPTSPHLTKILLDISNLPAINSHP
uniref:guanylate cyclase n=1 Tax=Placozoa sp. H4 TaxID=1034858 RepID=A0A7G7LKC7_9METZ|nr:soluble GCY-like 7 [Placozoa sp. H4]